MYHDLTNHSNKLKINIYDKSVLVIGGAGSIGSAYISEILKFKPKKLVVVDVNENALTELSRYLRSKKEQFIPVEYKTYPMDFSSEIFEKMYDDNGGFNIVANFAAHKHVRSEKDIYSISSMMNNNIFKLHRLLNFLIKNPPNHFFCVSTDKASSPVNIMGASKK